MIVQNSCRLLIAIVQVGALVLLASACSRQYDAPPPAPPPVEEPTPAPMAEPQPEMSTDDAVIHDRVHAALERAPGVHSDEVQVVVEGGNVYLSGWVDSEDERETAHNVAHAVEGVRAVYYSELRVR